MIRQKKMYWMRKQKYLIPEDVQTVINELDQSIQAQRNFEIENKLRKKRVLVEKDYEFEIEDVPNKLILDP